MKLSILISVALLLGSFAWLAPKTGRVAAATTNGTTEVFANQGWQDSTLALQAGQQFRIDYVSGKWTYWNDGIAPFDANGDSYICSAESCCEPLPSARKGGLLGKVGDAVFFIGNGGTFTAPGSGTLLLRMNDCDDSFADNSGSVIVKLNTTSALTITNVAVVEGTGTTPTYVGFKVKLSIASSQSVTVDYATIAGTAHAISDYRAKAGTLTFAPGQTRKTIWIAVKADTRVEADETFQMLLSNPAHATITDARGVAIILNDDSTPPPTDAPSEATS